MMRSILPIAVIGLFLFACGGPQTNVLGERLSAADGSYDYVWLQDQPGDTVSLGDYVEYHAYVRNGEEVVFSTRDRGGVPARHELTEAAAREPLVQMLFKMSPGDSVAVYTPLPAGQPTPPGFEGATEIRYDVKLINELSEAEYESAMAAMKQKQEAEMVEFKAQEADIKNQTTTVLEEYKANNLENIQTTETGLKYIMLEEGDGERPTVGQPVSVHYYGMLTDGTPFDNSFGRGAPIDFPLGQGRVIAGWDEGIALLKGGSKAVFFVPSELAYGAAGRPGIPADSELVFYVDLQ